VVNLGYYNVQGNLSDVSIGNSFHTELQAVIRCRHGFPFLQTYKNSSRHLVQSEQERNQHVYWWQRFNREHQRRKGQEYGQHSWHRPELQNDFYQYAINTFRYICLGLGFSRGFCRGEVDPAELRHLLT
jgi:hypothetical protein